MSGYEPSENGLGTIQARPACYSLLWLAAAGVGHQQGTVVLQEQLLDLALALLVHVCTYTTKQKTGMSKSASGPVLAKGFCV